MASFIDAKGRTIGEDVNFNGLLDSGEDSDGEGVLSSPVSVRTMIYAEINMKRIFKNNKAFSLVEVMVVVFIFVMVSAALHTVIVTGSRSWVVNESKVEVLQEVRKAVSRLTAELAQSGRSAIDVSAKDCTPGAASPATCTEALTDCDSTPPEPLDGYDSSVSFYVSDGATASGGVTWASDPIQYSLGGSGGDQLIRTQGMDSTIIAQNILSFSVTRFCFSPDIVTVTVVVEDPDDRVEPMGATFNVQLRN